MYKDVSYVTFKIKLTTGSGNAGTCGKLHHRSWIRLRQKAGVFASALRVFGNRVLRRIFGPRRDKVTGEWGKLHNVELNDLNSSTNIVRVMKSRKMRWAGHIARMGERRGLYRVLVGKPEGKRPFGRPRHRWEDNIKIDSQEAGCGDMDWIEVAQDRDIWQALVNAVMKLGVQ